MKTANIMSNKSPQELLSSRSTRRQFHWSTKVRDEEEDYDDDDDHQEEEDQPSNSKASSTILDKKNEARRHDDKYSTTKKPKSSPSSAPRKKLPAMAVSRIRSVLSAFNTYRSHHFPRRGLGPKVIGTLFGCRRGNVSFVFQREHNTSPVFFIELATPITGLVREMASGLVRIALECDKELEGDNRGGASRRLLEEPIWRTYCNGKKCGMATKRELGANELKILKTVEPISMGAGVLPGFNGSGSGPDGELMYMRAKFERVVGSRDSEAFYMMNPDSNGAPELSIYLLRV